VTSDGTKLPLSMYELISAASVPPFDRSARSKSPVLKCTHPSRSCRSWHVVPLPDPGFPSTNTIRHGGSVEASAALRCLSAFKRSVTKNAVATNTATEKGHTEMRDMI
jgi:hypothetical protein